MRKMFAVAMTLAMVGAVGFSQSAEAGVTYDFVFRSTDGQGGAIANGAAINGGKTFEFTSLAAANAAYQTGSFGGVGVTLDIIARTGEPTILIATSVMFDDSNALGVAKVGRWAGVGVAFNMMNGEVTASMTPIGGLACTSNTCSSWNGQITPPNGPPSLVPGTYNLGSIVWDTSGMTANSAVMTVIVAGLDGTILPGGTNISGTEQLEMGFISIVPEPATAGLLGLGLAGLVLAGRRRRA